MYTRQQYLQDVADAKAEFARTGDRNTFSSKISQIIANINSESSDKKSKEFLATDISELISLDPIQADKIQSEALQAKKAGQLSAGLELLYNGVQMSASQGQIARAKQAAAQIKQPGLPGVPGRDPLLNQALNNAQLGTINANDALRPAQAGIQDAYRSALNQAQVASGGQAGAYQGMANLANLQRMRANLGLAPIAQEAKLQNQSVYNNLLQQRLAETQNQFQNRYANAGIAYDQYNRDAEAIGALGSAGRTNLLNAGQRLTSNLQGLAPYLAQQRPVLTNTSPMLNFDNSTNDYIKKIQQENSMRNRGWDSSMMDNIGKTRIS